MICYRENTVFLLCRDKKLLWRQEQRTMRISACVITKDEELNISKWIESIQSIADERIVIDTGSTDQTVKIAREAGARVIFFAWQEDFSAAKNFAVTQATGDWILFLDADEVFTAASLRLIPEYLAAYHQKRIDAILCKIRNIDADKGGRLLQISHGIRIFRNAPGLQFTGSVHEQLKHQARELEIGVAEDLEIIHTGYSSSISRKKAQRNLKILQKAVRLHGMQPEYGRYFCDCYEELGDFKLAEQYARQYIQNEIKAYGENREVYKKWLDLVILINEQPTQKVQFLLKKIIEKFPKDPAFIFIKGKYCLSKGQYKAAQKLFLQSLEMDRSLFLAEPGSGDGILFESERPEAHYLLGKTFLKTGQAERAGLYLEQAVRSCPLEKKYFLSLFHWLEQNKPYGLFRILQLYYDMRCREKREFLLQVMSALPMEQAKACQKTFFSNPV